MAKLSLVKVISQLCQRHGFSCHSDVCTIDFPHQSDRHLARRSYVAQLLGSTQDDSAMYSVAARSRFPPSVAPNVWPEFSAFSNHTSLLHVVPSPCLRFR